MAAATKVDDISNSERRNIIEKLVLCKRYHEAFELLEILECEGGNDVKYSTYDALVSACIGLKSIRGVKRMFNYMLNYGFEPDLYTRNRVLLMHVKCGMMIDARRLFDTMPEMNLVSWNIIIGGLVDGWAGTHFSWTTIACLHFEDDIFVSCVLIDMYSKCGSVEDVRFVFDEMPEKPQ
ncbi:Pentatricopeptide repeat-containing protein [Forsythia ovata]|uniref:Pentatricopeptide repeat-containing protein n=1 Tax=Forsythia ovata TaxID=205694 RepID=A0ABD1WLR0_9LAMI